MIIDWVATGLGWLGTYLVGQANKPVYISLGWASWVSATTLWALIGIELGITGLMVANLGYLAFEVPGLIRSLRKLHNHRGKHEDSA